MSELHDKARLMVTFKRGAGCSHAFVDGHAVARYRGMFDVTFLDPSFTERSNDLALSEAAEIAAEAGFWRGGGMRPGKLSEVTVEVDVKPTEVLRGS